MLKECGKNTKSKKQSRAKTHTGARTERMDKSGRRSSKTVGGQTTTYIYNGQNLIAERGASVAEFLFGPDIDEPLAMSRSGSTYFYDVDGLGSAALVNDSSGTVQDKYLYDGWGITRSSTTPISNPFVYTARESGEAGLFFYRARYYNPSIGRFVSEDPLIHYGSYPDTTYKQLFLSRLNLFRYGNNNPVIYKDPSGEWVVVAIRVAAAAVRVITGARVCPIPRISNEFWECEYYYDLCTKDRSMPPDHDYGTWKNCESCRRECGHKMGRWPFYKCPIANEFPVFKK